MQTYVKVANEISAAGAETIAEDLAESFVSGQIDSIEIFTTKFKNMMSYSAQKWPLLPIKIETKTEKETGLNPVMIFEPSNKAILQKIVPLYITNTIYQALLEAQASELASRITMLCLFTISSWSMVLIFPASAAFTSKIT